MWNYKNDTKRLIIMPQKTKIWHDNHCQYIISFSFLHFSFLYFLLHMNIASIKYMYEYERLVYWIKINLQSVFQMVKLFCSIIRKRIINNFAQSIVLACYLILFSKWTKDFPSLFGLNNRSERFFQLKKKEFALAFVIKSKSVRRFFVVLTEVR